MRLSETMTILMILIIVSVQTTHADIGEKLRLGQPIKRVPQDNFGAALSNIGSSSKNIGPHHDYDENNLDRLCNDPFHSFLCKPVGPRKNRLDGRLRPGAVLPNGAVLSGSSSNLQELKTSAKLQEEPLKTGGAILSSGIEPASSNAPGTRYNNGYLPPPPVIPSQTQQVIRTQKIPSKEYLPISSNPIPLPQDNIQIPLPLEQPQQTVIQYTPVIAPQPVITTHPVIAPQPVITTHPVIAPQPIITTHPVIAPQPVIAHQPVVVPTQIPTTTRFIVKPSQPTNLVPFQRQQQLVTTRPTLQPALLNSYPIGSSSIPRPSNQYLPIAPQPQPIDIRVIPDSTNLSPLIEGGAILAEGRQKSPAELRQLPKEGGKKHSERQHTLEELCNDAFHSFLCQPITKPRKRIDGNIRPGAKIPPHVLQGAHSFDSNRKKLLPLKEGSAILSEGREPDKLGQAQGYVYPKPPNPLLVYPQASSVKTIIPNIQPASSVIFQSRNPSTNVALPTSEAQQFLISETIIPAPAVPTYTLIPSNTVQIPLVQTSATRIQKPLQNLQDQASFIRSQKIQIFTTPRPIVANKGNPLAAPSTTSVQRNDNLIEIFKPVNQDEGQNSKQIEGYTYSKPVGKPFPPIVSSSAQLTPQATGADGYNYPKPIVPFTLPTSTLRTPSTPNLLYIPTFNEATTLSNSQNQIVTTTVLPTVGTTVTTPKPTDGYVYQRPSIPFPSPSQIIPSNVTNQPTLIASPSISQQPNTPAPGYSYPRPAKPFTLPPTKNDATGYSYPKPAVSFTLPPRQPSTNVQQFGYKLTPITTNIYNELNPNVATLVNNLPLTRLDTSDDTPDDPLPPSSQFEIIRP